MRQICDTVEKFHFESPFTGQLTYAKTETGLKLTLTVAPTTSPMTYHNWQYMDNDFTATTHMTTQVIPLIASNLIVRSCNKGFEVELDKEIDIKLLLDLSSGIRFEGGIGNIGSIRAVAAGKLNNFGVTVEVSDQNQPISNGQFVLDCESVESCAFGFDAQLPGMQPITSNNKFTFQDETVTIYSTTMTGAVKHFIEGQISQSNIAIYGTSGTFGKAKINCGQTFTNGESTATAGCEVDVNGKFFDIQIKKSRNGDHNVAIKTNDFALVARFNQAKILQMRFYKITHAVSSVKQLTSKALSPDEVFEVTAIWPLVNNKSLRKIMLNVEYLQEPLVKTQLVLAGTRSTQARS